MSLQYLGVHLDNVGNYAEELQGGIDTYLANHYIVYPKL